jgi:hypothetical protein
MDEVKVVPVECLSCEHFVPVIHLDTCAACDQVIVTLVECPLGKWNGN